MKDLIKLAFGTNIVKNYIQDPSEAIVENQIMKNKASLKVAENPFLQATEALLPLLTSTAQQALPLLMAYGGNINGLVEVEGGEVISSDAPGAVKVKGKSHEQGGVPMNLTSDLDVFSKRIKVDGVTIADRENKRKKKEQKLIDLLTEYSHDMILKNTQARIKKNNDKDREYDKQLQGLVSQLMNINDNKLGYGTSPTGGDPSVDTTLIDDVNPLSISDILQLKSFMKYGDLKLKPIERPKWMTKDFNTEYYRHLKNSGAFNNFDLTTKKGRCAYQKSIGAKCDGIFGKETMLKSHKKYPIKSISVPEMKAMPIISPGIKKTMDMIVENNSNQNSSDTNGSVTNINGGNNKKFNIGTVGDLVKIFGDWYAGNEQMKNTLRQRAEDQPHINPYEKVGDDAIRRLEDAKGYIQSQKDNAYRTALLNHLSSLNRNHNNARGVNQLRALDLSSDILQGQQQSKADDIFSKLMMDIIGKQAGIENQASIYKGQGKLIQERGNNADRDAFYTGMSKNISTMAEGIQHMGKDLNLMKYSNVEQNLINELFQYYDIVNGKLVPKKNN